jgi:DNA-directed RNA polymerase specialized sigma24 family protein
LGKEVPEIFDAYNKWRPRIFAWARKLNMSGEFDFEDLQQDAMMFMMWAKSTYQPGRSSFNTWAYRALQQEFLNRLKAKFCQKSGDFKVFVCFEDVYDMGVDGIEPMLIDKESEEWMMELSKESQTVASVLLQTNNIYSKPFWVSYYRERDVMGEEGKKKKRLTVEKHLMNFLCLSKMEINVCYEEISRCYRENRNGLGELEQSS